MMQYWDWWVGAIALAAVTVGYHVLLGHRFGVSSKWEKVVHWDSERRAEQADQQMASDAGAFEAALRAATAAEFGDADAGNVAVLTESAAPIEPVPAPTPAPAPIATPNRLPMSANLLFLVMILVGAFVAALINGRFELRGDMGPAFADIVVDGPLMWPTLFVGGVLVGVGTRMAGGCSSGHGMSGCSRLQPVSLLATSVFFGTAVVVSSLLYWVI